MMTGTAVRNPRRVGMLRIHKRASAPVAQLREAAVNPSDALYQIIPAQSALLSVR